MTYKTILPILLLVSLATVAGAQSQATGAMQRQSAPQLTGDAAPRNLLDFRLGVSAEYDDNLGSLSYDNEPHALFTVSPRIAWNVSRNHVIWALDYFGSEGRSSTTSSYRRRTHAFGMDLNYQASKRLSFTVNNNFSKSSDPYYQPHQSEFVTGPGIIDRPNTSFFGTNTERTSEQVGASIAYRLSARSDFQLGGTFTMLSYDAGSATAQSFDSYQVGGHASINHQFSPRRSAGASYNVMKMTSPGGWYTMTHRVMLSHDFKLSGATGINVFAGPEYVSSGFPALSGSLTSIRWSWSAGATYRWSGAHTGFTADFVRQTSDAGGLRGSVTLTSGGFNVTRTLSAKLKAQVFGRYNFNDPTVMNPGFGGKSHYASGGGSVMWTVRRNVSVSCSYSRQETRRPLTAFPDWVDRTHATISLNYSFSHPLGR